MDPSPIADSPAPIRATSSKSITQIILVRFKPDYLHRHFRIRNPLTRNLLAEFYGTFILLFIGTSIIAQYVVSGRKLNTWIQINIGWGFGFTFASVPVSKLSGGHLNPAISLLMWTFGEISFLRFILYSVVQTIGAFFGACATYVVYFDAIDEFDGGNRTAFGPTGTASIFTTFPGTYLSVSSAYIDQIVGTGFFALFIAAITDRRNKIPKWTHPLLFGLVLILIGTSFGMNVGYPINPARDFGPRIFTLIVYGTDVFTYPYVSWFLVPIIAPLTGAVIFGWSYYIFAGMHIPDDDDDVITGPRETRQEG